MGVTMVYLIVRRLKGISFDTLFLCCDSSTSYSINFHYCHFTVRTYSFLRGVVLSRHIIELPDITSKLDLYWQNLFFRFLDNWFYLVFIRLYLTKMLIIKQVVLNCSVDFMHNKLKIHSNVKFKRVPRVEWIPFAVVLNVSHGFKNIFFHYFITCEITLWYSCIWRYWKTVILNRFLIPYVCGPSIHIFQLISSMSGVFTPTTL